MGRLRGCQARILLAGLAVLALIRPAFAVANAVALAVALAGDLYAGRRHDAPRRAHGE